MARTYPRARDVHRADAKLPPLGERNSISGRGLGSD